MSIRIVIAILKHLGPKSEHGLSQVVVLKSISAKERQEMMKINNLLGESDELLRKASFRPARPLCCFRTGSR